MDSEHGRTDEELMEAYVGGDVGAFQVLMDRHAQKVFNFILRRTGGNRESAEDLLQEVFLRVVHRASGFKAKSKFTTWLYTIARNLCIDAGRKASYRQHVALDQPLGRDGGDGATLLDRVPDRGPGPDSRTRDLRFKAALQEALAKLPDEQREVFLMREFQGLKFREIAVICDIPENTVKSRMRYALDFLRKALAVFRETI